MSRRTGPKLKDYCKAVEICILEKYQHIRHYYNKGSVYTFEIFEKKNDDVPSVVWSVHFGHNRKQEIWSRDDLKKIYERTMVPKERFFEVLKAITRKDFS